MKNLYILVTFNVIFVSISASSGMVFDMRVDDESGKSVIEFFVCFISNYTENIKTRKNWVSQIDIVSEVDRWVVDSTKRICSCDNTASSLE